MRLGIYGTEETWRRMQDFCDRYGNFERFERFENKTEQKAAVKDDKAPVDPARAG